MKKNEKKKRDGKGREEVLETVQSQDGARRAYSHRMPPSSSGSWPYLLLLPLVLSDSAYLDAFVKTCCGTRALYPRLSPCDPHPIAGIAHPYIKTKWARRRKDPRVNDISLDKDQ